MPHFQERPDGTTVWQPENSWDIMDDIPVRPRPAADFRAFRLPRNIATISEEQLPNWAYCVSHYLPKPDEDPDKLQLGSRMPWRYSWDSTGEERILPGDWLVEDNRHNRRADEPAVFGCWDHTFKELFERG